MSDLREFQSRLGYEFADEELLRLALTHPSVLHESGGAGQHNQRLEFLGDAVLQLIFTRELYEKFPRLSEGPLTKARAKMVNRHTLADQARQLGLGEELILSRGEESHGGRARPSILADAFEAVVGAVFLDGGFQAAQAFVLRHFRQQFGEPAEVPNLENPKGELQELLQAKSPESPEYRILTAQGPDHDRSFECAVYYRGDEIGRGMGKSKKEAESAAALAALKNVQG